jgi:hypothetical protein
MVTFFRDYGVDPKAGNAGGSLIKQLHEKGRVKHNDLKELGAFLSRWLNTSSVYRHGKCLRI